MYLKILRNFFRDWIKLKLKMVGDVDLKNNMKNLHTLSVFQTHDSPKFKKLFFLQEKNSFFFLENLKTGFGSLSGHVCTSLDRLENLKMSRDSSCNFSTPRL